MPIHRTKLPAGPPTRHRTKLPPERVAEMGFIWDGNGRVVAPWPKHVLWPVEEAKLLAVIDQIEHIGDALHVPCWLFPDGRAPVPVGNVDPRWLARWSEGRASYVRG